MNIEELIRSARSKAKRCKHCGSETRVRALVVNEAEQFVTVSAFCDNCQDTRLVSTPRKETEQ